MLPTVRGATDHPHLRHVVLELEGVLQLVWGSGVQGVRAALWSEGELEGVAEVLFAQLPLR